MSASKVSQAARSMSSGSVVAGLVIAVGIGLRLRLFLANRPLWLDEAWMSLRILSDGFREHKTIQAASPAFLLAERVAAELLGYHEVALRLLPFLAAIGTVLLTWKIAERLLDFRGALLATALVALSPVLIRYSGEVKPYSLDAFFAVATIWTTLRVLQAPSKPNWIRWFAVGLGAVLLTLPGVLIVLGTSVALLADRSVRNQPSSRWIVVAFSAAWVGVFAVLYNTAYSETASSTFMQRYWAGAFLERSFPELLGDLSQAGKALLAEALFSGTLARPPKIMYVVLVFALVGAGTLVWRRPISAILLLSPALLAAAAALFDRWPLVPRLLLFAVPSALLVLAAGLSAVAAQVSVRLGNWGSLVAWSLVFVTLLPGLVGAYSSVVDPRPGWDTPAAMDVVSRRSLPGEPVYVGANAFVACEFYTLKAANSRDARACRIGSTTVFVGKFRPVRRQAGEALEGWENRWASGEAARLRQKSGRFWFLFVGARRIHEDRTSGVRSDAIPPFLDLLEKAGAIRLQEWMLDGAEVYLYELAGDVVTIKGPV